MVELKIQLETLKQKLSEQNKECHHLKATYSEKLNNLDQLLFEKENKMKNLKKNYQDIEEKLNEEKKRTEIIQEKMVCVHDADNQITEDKKISENQKIEELIDENESLLNQIKIIKKSNEELQELNSVFSKDFQRMKFKSMEKVNITQFQKILNVSSEIIKFHYFFV